MDLNHKIFGQGPPLIILHGLFGMLDNWQTLGRRWGEDHTVFLVDLRNHGRSPHVPEHDYPSMAEDVVNFMAENGMYEASILGHSMGGKVAMQMALHHADQVSKLVVVDIAPKAYPGGHEVILEALQGVNLSTVEERSEADASLQTRIEEMGIRQFLLKNLSRQKEGGYRWKMNLPVLIEHYQEVLANIEEGYPYEGSALFVRGDRSRYIQDEDIPNILDHFPQARVETVVDAGHWVHAEQPQALFDRVTAFLHE